MNTQNRTINFRLAMMILLAAIFAAACGGGGGTIFGSGIGSGVVGVAPPTVTAVAPANKSTGVAINLKAIAAALSEPVAPLTGAASFTLTCAAPCVSPSGTASIDASGKNAVLSLATGTALSPLTTYTATISGARSIATGLALATPYAWTFSTGAVADATLPRVAFTVPATSTPGPTTGVPANTAISALFTEDMNPATLGAASFKLSCAAPCVSPAGAVSYGVGNRTVVFTPAAVLAVGVTYTATITTAASDLAGNALAGNQAALPASSNYVWTFSTVAAAPAGKVSVLSTSPVAGAPSVCTNATINASFSVPSGLRMDPASINSAVFTVTGPAPALSPVVAASVVLDAATGRIATFTPLSSLTAGLTYTATLQGGASGVKDQAVPGNEMTSNFSWSFTTAACVTPGAAALGSAATYGIMATAATTSTGPTQINGDVALNPGTSQGIPPPQINGTIHVGDSAAVQAQNDLLAAYNYAKGLPPGTGPFALGGGADLSGRTLPPGTYTSGSTVLITGPAAATLDGGGDANAVWVFQIGSSLTTVAGSVQLINGAQAKNVFWVPTSDATIGVGTSFQGTILAGRDVTGKTGATLNGRILAGAITAGTIALDSNTVNVPAP